MNLCVFGASGPVGRATVRAALDAGHTVRAVTRRPADFGVVAPGLRVVEADVHDPAAVAAALRGTDAVVSAVGVVPDRREVTTYSLGTAHVLRAMRDQGVRRIVCVSSKHLSGRAPGDPLLYRLLVARLLGRVNRNVYADMRRMEHLLLESDRDWTVLRPAALYASERLSDYLLTSDLEAGVLTATSDLADALLVEALGPTPHVRQTLDVLTVDRTPPFVVALVRQGTLHRR